jgi:hypothetical protein
MAQQHLTILFLVSTIISCHQDRKSSNRLELFKLGFPEQLDTNNRNKKGSERYFRFDQSSDSVLIKFYDTINPQTGEPNSPFPFKSQYCWKLLHPVEKANLDNSINLLLQLKDRIIPNNKRHPDFAGCDLFGVWIAVLTDSTDAKHYYTFISVNLPKQLYDLCSDIDHYTYQNKLTNPINPIKKINTDSLVSYYIDNYLKDELLEFEPPPIKTNVKFKPPTIEPDE